MSSNDDSVYNIDNASLATSTPDDEIESLPDSAPSDDTDDDDEQEETDAEKEWKESLQQLELILTMVPGAIRRQILWEEVCLLGVSIAITPTWARREGS